MSHYFGIDIGGTTIKIGLVSEGGEIRARRELPTRKGADPTPVLQDIRMTLEEILAEEGLERADISGIGMAAPGPVTDDGILHGTVNIGWGDVALGQLAQQVIGISPVCIGNDARVAALGEAVYGAGRGANSMLMVTLGTGVGGGIIQNGQILMGESGVAGEIGHMTIDPYETESCGCGKKGCLEQYASATGVVQRAKRLLQEGDEASSLRHLPRMSAEDVWAAARGGDVLAMQVVDFAAERLGIALANAGYIVDTERIVIGGGMSGAGDFLLNKIRPAYQKQVFPHCRNKEIVLAALGNDAGVLGAAALVQKGNGKHSEKVE